MASLGDFTRLLNQHGGSTNRREQDIVRAHLMYNGRSVELATKCSHSGAKVARVSGSSPAFVWFCEELRDTAEQSKDVELEELWDETEAISQHLRAGQTVTSDSWRSHSQRLGMECALPMTIESCDTMFQAFVESCARRMFDASNTR